MDKNIESKNVEITIRLAMQLIGDDDGNLREITVDGSVTDFEDCAVMVRELIKTLILEHAMKHGRALARMQATVSQDGFKYQVNGLFDEKVQGLKIDVGFLKKSDINQTLVDVWTEKIGGDVNFKRIPSASGTQTLH